MTPEAVLIELLARLGARKGGAVFVSAEEVRQWPPVAVAAMKSQKLLMNARPVSSLVCPGCERECVMPVHTLPTGRRSPASFIVCDKRDDINRVPVSTEQLTQWRCDAGAYVNLLQRTSESAGAIGRLPMPGFGRSAWHAATSAARCSVCRSMVVWLWPPALAQCR